MLEPQRDEPNLTERPQHFRCKVHDNVFPPLVGQSAHGRPLG